MKIKLKTALVNLKNEAMLTEGEPTTVGLILANIVLTPHKQKDGFRPLKAYELAKKFYDQEEVELDNSDFIQLKEIIEINDAGYQPLVIAQLQQHFINSEKETEKNDVQDQKKSK